MNFEHITLEKAGLSKEIIDEFLRLLDEKNAGMDSVILLRGGKICFEKYWEPYDEKTNHRMYSVGKSFTAIAIGLLIGDGKLSVEDYVCDYFPEKLPENVHPFIREMQVKHLLTMSTAHKSTTYKNYDGDWVESFFHVEPDYHPGTIFSYDTSATHVLCALVQKLSGKDMQTFLKERVLDEIGYSSSEWLTDEAGVVRGGDGLYCTSRDLAAVAQLCMDGGVYNGKQLIPADYLKDMLSVQISTEHKLAYDEQLGYGYQVWGNREEGGFTFYGMGGQLAVCFPKKNFVLVTTGNMTERGKDIRFIYESFYEAVYPRL
ncbi:MAG: serine hydrolase [Lachnospiraceae bacterium]|nr:serine hydrolase [Lachnospiraceae bacterium]